MKRLSPPPRSCNTRRMTLRSFPTYFCLQWLVLCASAGNAAAAEAPRLRAAVNLLERAKASPSPLQLLQEAREQVRKAKAHAGAHRTAALEAIADAIEIASDGRDPDGSIDRALSQLQAQISSR